MSPVAHRPITSTPIINRLYTAQNGPYDGIHWEKRTATIKGASGTHFEMNNVEVPSSWSQLATDIIASKYFRKAGVPIGTGTGSETSARQVIDRIAKAVRKAGEQQGGYFVDADEAQAFEDELTYMLINQIGAFNSPVWFNTGLFESYGIKGSPSGRWATNADGKTVLMDNDYERPGVSACFIQSIEDDLMDIAEHTKREMRVFKAGGGSGTNYSNIRGEGEPLSGGGTSSGLMSFLKIFDSAAGATKSGGTTRRAARMVVVNDDHPDILDFVRWKAKEEDKLAALVAQGYDSDFNGEAVRTIGGQNSNNSVRATDAFMRAVENDGEWQTRRRTDGRPHKSYKAREIMREIAKAAHRCADPGMQFHDTCNEWNTVSQTDVINSTNPCSEFSFVDNTSCNLASVNLVRFYDAATDTFDVKSFQHACRVFITAQEILVDHASYPTQSIAQRSHALRPLGLGYSNLGALLMRMGYPYDSDEGRAVGGAITALMCGTAWDQSAKLAECVGPFPNFAHNRTSMLQVGRKHRNEVANVGPMPDHVNIKNEALAVWGSAIEHGEQVGFRNAQMTVLAPTGTISFVMDCDTFGVEPDFALVKHKKLAGGGTFKIVNQSVSPTLKRLGYTDAQIDAITAHVQERESIEGAPGLKEEHVPIFDCANRCGPDGKRFIRPMAHLEMMSVAQPFLCGAISKTVNLPEETTVEEIEDIYIRSWKMGLKAIALYRDNSKGCQVLNTTKAAVEKVEEEPNVAHRQRLPKKRGGFTQEATVGGHKVFVRTGEYEDGRLGEIFIDMQKEGAPLRAWADCFAIAVSLGLQYGVPLQEFVDAYTFAKFEPSGLVRGHDHVRTAMSVPDYIFRALAIEYLHQIDLAHVHPDKDKQPKEVVKMAEALKTMHASNKSNGKMAAGELCAKCGGMTIRSGTCSYCINCAESSGCS